MSDDEHAYEIARAQHDAAAGYHALDRVKIREKTRRALEAMAYEGLSPTQAADRFGIRRDNFSRVMKRPAVRQAYTALVGAIRDNAAQAAYMRINEMSMNAKSERVRLKANEWIAGVDGIAKVQRVEGRMRHQVIFGGFEYPDLETKDVTPGKAEK